MKMAKENNDRVPVIICGGQTGRAVVYGYVDGGIPGPNDPVRIYKARMVLSWPSECNGLLGLAADGPKGNTRLTPPVDIVTDITRQAVSVSRDAAEKFDEWR
jgi:hypothetical protein